MLGKILAAVLAVAVPAGSLSAKAPTQESALEVSRAAIGRQVGDHAFTDSGGKTLRLSDFRGKPLVISFVYTSCDHVCPQITQTLARAVDEAAGLMGRDAFSVVTVGFDTRMDSEVAMRAFAKANGLGNVSNWAFLSGELPSVIGLAEDVGFQFWGSSQGFDHLAQTTLLDREGRVANQVYGNNFPSYQLIDPLKDLVSGALSGSVRLSALLERVRLFCTVYDPRTERYRVDYSLYIEGAVGFLSLIAVGWLLVANWRRLAPKTQREEDMQP
ncbi:MAG: SCO family protein [Alphaproteobacteria bacterium]|nr:SCO family protein [Alphaproteobacteria bacterium]MBF0129839.1 SCO family protein [Alphaproteobacteria bacterium]